MKLMKVDADKAFSDALDKQTALQTSLEALKMKYDSSVESHNQMMDSVMVSPDMRAMSYSSFCTSFRSILFNCSDLLCCVLFSSTFVFLAALYCTHYLNDLEKELKAKAKAM